MPNSTLPFQPYCPSGGTFYVCNTSKSTFIGCCNSDPCSSVNGCSAGSLEPASFDPAKWGTFPDQNCDDGRFWTCAATKPAFLGCCKSNPCAIGSCPVGDLAGMRLSDDPKKAAAFLGTSSAISSSTTPSNSTSTAMPAEIPHQTGLPVAAIGGIAIGIVLLLALAIVMFFLWRRTVRLRKSVESSRGLPGQDGFDNLSGTTYPAMAHAQQAYKHNSNPSYAYSSLAPSPNFSPDLRRGHFSAASGSSYDPDPRYSPYGGRSPQLGSDNGMVYSPPLPPVQELEALEQQMSEMDAGTEQTVKVAVNRKPVGDKKNRENEDSAHNPDRHADAVSLPPGRTRE